MKKKILKVKDNGVVILHSEGSKDPETGLILKGSAPVFGWISGTPTNLKVGDEIDVSKYEYSTSDDW
jgi:hypothetical protein